MKICKTMWKKYRSNIWFQLILKSAISSQYAKLISSQINLHIFVQNFKSFLINDEWYGKGRKGGRNLAKTGWSTIITTSNKLWWWSKMSFGCFANVEAQPLEKHHFFLLLAFIVIFKAARKIQSPPLPPCILFIDEPFFKYKYVGKTQMKNND